MEPPALLVIDSIQTMFSDTIEGAPGTVSQVRGCAFELIRYAKDSGAALVLVGHVTKDGSIAGPRVLEHMVDVVMSFEGERSHQYRILRSLKNRFGPVDEIGVFAMAGQGLEEVSNPSSLFLSGREDVVPGSAVFPAMEGTRPVLVEIQALIVRLASGATPRRAVVGWDSGRMAMLLAVLEAGGAYLPLDLAHPADRLGSMLRGSGASLLLGSAALLERVPESGIPRLAVDRLEDVGAPAPRRAAPAPSRPRPHRSPRRARTRRARPARRACGVAGLPIGQHAHSRSWRTRPITPADNAFDRL